jgi:ribosomal protein S30
MEKPEISTTTLKLEKKTKERLDNLKEYKRETYDEILQKLLDILNSFRQSPVKARSQLIRIEAKNKKMKSKD